MQRRHIKLVPTMRCQSCHLAMYYLFTNRTHTVYGCTNGHMFYAEKEVGTRIAVQRPPNDAA